jgi:UDP-glucose:glycoprotein glucosyltransferase
VELALKKTDYLVVDDRATGGLQASANGIQGNSSSGRGMFSDILGDDPWSELSTPIAKEELSCTFTLQQN